MVVAGNLRWENSAFGVVLNAQCYTLVRYGRRRLPKGEGLVMGWMVRDHA